MVGVSVVGGFGGVLCLLGGVADGGRWLRGSPVQEVEVLGCFWVAVPRLEWLWGCPEVGEEF